MARIPDGELERLKAEVSLARLIEGSDLRVASLAHGFADASRNVTFGYTFNLAGQPSSVSVSNALYQNSSSLATGSYSPDGQNRYTSAGGSAVGYDGNANVNAIGAQGYGYDALNRMTSAGGATLAYDALSRLSQVSGGGGTTKFLYDGAQIIGEYNAAGALQRRYIPGPGLDNPYLWFEGPSTAAGNARWLLGDAFGSIIAVGTSGVSSAG